MIVLADLQGGTKKQREMFDTAICYMEAIINSPAFRYRVVNHKYTYTEDDSRDIYNKFMSGDDMYETGPEDGIMNIEVKFYYRFFARAIGYTYKSSRKSYFNTKFISIPTLVANMVHEYCHNIGYSHPFRKTSDRLDSVPYHYGNVAGEFARSLMGDS